MQLHLLLVVSFLGIIFVTCQKSCKTLNNNCATCSEDMGNLCGWCSSSSTCVNRIENKNMSLCHTDLTLFGDVCPVTWPAVPTFLPDWMSELMPAIGHLSLLDLSLPGTHDTLTYDLSLVPSDGGIDDYNKLAEIMHQYTEVIPDGFEDYIRQQAQTHAIDVTGQLNNGVRFFDFRIMYEYSDTNPDWYSLHLLESNNLAMKYFSEIRQWLDVHSNEIVVIWLSKHGGACNKGQDQYPNTPDAAKQAYWQNILTMFDGLVTNHDVTKIYQTSISEMIARNHRVVFYVSDYVEFTASSNFALDACLLMNELGPGATEQMEGVSWDQELFKSASSVIAANKASSKLLLMSMATGGPSVQMVSAFIIKFLPHNDTVVEKCASDFNIPGMNSWCPESLLDISQITNYYKQISLESVTENYPEWRFPNAIYLNGLDWDGTIRTGTQVPWGAKRSSDKKHQTTAYAYVDSLLLFNARYGCDLIAARSTESDAACSSLISKLTTRKAKYPAQYWDDPTVGRLSDWFYK